MTRATPALVALVALLTVLAAGCGSGGDNSSSSSGPTCSGSALLAAVKAGAGHDVTAKVMKTLGVRGGTVRCAQGYAGATFTSSGGSGDVFVVFKATGSRWKYLALGSADVCSGL